MTERLFCRLAIFPIPRDTSHNYQTYLRCEPFSIFIPCDMWMSTRQGACRSRMVLLPLNRTSGEMPRTPPPHRQKIICTASSLHNSTWRAPVSAKTTGASPLLGGASLSFNYLVFIVPLCRMERRMLRRLTIRQVGFIVRKVDWRTIMRGKRMGYHDRWAKAEL